MQTAETRRNTVRERFPDSVIPWGAANGLAAELGVSRQRVDRIRAELGMTTGRRAPKPKPRRRTPFERFAEKFEINPETECWDWTASQNGLGYAKFHVQFKGGRERYGHRYSYHHFVGVIPASLELDHLCRNKRCVNPDHLEAVTGKVNVQRAHAARRRERRASS